MQGEKFNQFIDENRSPVCRWIMQRFHLSEDDAKDIYQESSIALYHKIDTELSSSLERFFAGIWYRQTMKFLRKRRREVTLDLTDSGMNPENRTGVSLRKVNELLEKAESCPPPPDEVIDQERMREAVTKALDEMAERCRTLLSKFYLEGYNWMELAAQLNLKNANTAKSAANRCRRTFEEKFKELAVYLKKQ